MIKYPSRIDNSRLIHAPIALFRRLFTHGADTLIIGATVIGLLVAGGMISQAVALSGDRAFEHLVAQCEMGPRNPGSPGHKKCLAYIQQVLRDSGGRVQLQTWSHSFPVSFRLPEPVSVTGSINENPETDAETIWKEHEITNIIGRFGPDRSGGLLFGAHWDTRPWADHDPDSTLWLTPIIGANDGASGVALLLALAEEFQRKPPPIPVTLVFFDGEDSGRTNRVDEWSIGAQFFAASLSTSLYPEMALIVDMVASNTMVLSLESQCRELFAHEAQLIDQIAFDIGLHGYATTPTPPLTDDHIPLIQAGIRTLLLIDFRDPYWHTQNDIPANCSPANLGSVGELVSRLVYDGYFR